MQAFEYKSRSPKYFTSCFLQLWSKVFVNIQLSLDGYSDVQLLFLHLNIAHLPVEADLVMFLVMCLYMYVYVLIFAYHCFKKI